jgi:hypothetical protein
MSQPHPQHETSQRQLETETEGLLEQILRFAQP